MPDPSQTPYIREAAYPQRYRDRRFSEGSGPRTHRREVHALEALLSTVPASPRRWLDMPSGAGRLSQLLPGSATTQVDLVHGMLAASAAPGPKCCASGHALPFADQTFDGALSMRLFQHIADSDERRQILAELRRVTHGILLVSYFDTRSVQHWRRRIRRRMGKTRSGRSTCSWTSFQGDLRAAGWTPLRRRALVPLWSEQVIVLAT